MTLYTLAQAAERLGKSPASLRVYVHRGILRAEKIGRDWLVSDKDLAAFKARERGPGRPRKEGPRKPTGPVTVQAPKALPDPGPSVTAEEGTD